MNWRDLCVWQHVHDLVLEVYNITAAFPKSEIYGLTSQLRRAAVSIPANIVEGQSRNTTREYLQFLFNSRGSLEEVRYYILLSRELGYLNQTNYDKLDMGYTSASKMINALIRSLKARNKAV